MLGRNGQRAKSKSRPGTNSVTMRIYRSTEEGNKGRFDSFDIPIQRWTTVLDALLYIKAYKDHHRNMKPYLINPEIDLRDNPQLSEFLQNPADADKVLQFSYCIKCGLCYSACPTLATDTKFPGPQALAQAYRYSADTRYAGSRYGLTSIDSRHDLWRCHFSGSCSEVCPKGVDPALGIQLLRGNIMSIAKRRKQIAELKQYTRINPQID